MYDSICVSPKLAAKHTQNGANEEQLSFIFPIFICGGKALFPDFYLRHPSLIP
jgi:hypothetical protein